MNCSNCGTSNNVGSKFCIRCGQNLSEVQSVSPTSEPSFQETPVQSFQEVQTQTVNNIQVQNENNFQNFTNTAQTINDSISNSTQDIKISFMSCFFIILAVILKPFTAFKEELNKFNGFKNSAILSLIVSGVATLINLISSMLSAVRVKSFDWSSGGYKTTWTWENLKNLDYVEVIGKNFLIYLGIILAIAAVYYIASLIIKKQTNFSRLLGISAIAVTPILICSLVLSPLLSLIWSEITMPIIIIGAVYTIVLLYEGMNNEVLSDGNVKYYFNLICFSILGIAAYYLYMKLFMSSISDGLSDLLDLFG